MKAIVQDRYGPPEMLTLREVDRPVPAANEVLIRVRAASINARDWHVMRGDPYVARLMDRSTFGRTGPKVKIPGTDFAGVVEAVGAGSRSRFTGRIPKVTIEVRDGSARADAAVREAQTEMMRRTE